MTSHGIRGNSLILISYCMVQFPLKLFEACPKLVHTIGSLCAIFCWVIICQVRFGDYAKFKTYIACEKMFDVLLITCVKLVIINHNAWKSWLKSYLAGLRIGMPFITVMTHGLPIFSRHWHLDCCFNSSNLTTKKTWKPRIIIRVWFTNVTQTQVLLTAS